jgi:hypothetical protein
MRRGRVIRWLACGLAATGSTLPAQSPRPNLFAVLVADREEVYVGEMFHLTLAVYVTGATLGRQIMISDLPPAERLRIAPFEELPIEKATIEGRDYELRKYRCAAHAPAPGTLRLAPSLRGALIEVVRSYFFVHQQERPVDIPVDLRTLEVLPLPESGRPSDFSGAVGTFALKAEASPRDVAVGDLVTLAIEVAGDGLLDGVTPPSVAVGPDFRTYELKVVSRVGSAGRRLFEQTVVPLTTNAASFGPVRFSVFDPRVRAYRTLTAGPFTLAFHPERAASYQVYVPPTAAATGMTARTASAFRLKPCPARLRRAGDRPWFAHRGLLPAFLLPPLAAVAVAGVWRRHRATGRRVRPTPSGPAAGTLAERLRALEQHACVGAAEAFYAGAWSLLGEMIAARRGAAPRSQTSRDMVAWAAASGLPAESAAALERVLTRAEAFRYATRGTAVEGTGADLVEAAREVARLARQLERLGS